MELPDFPLYIHGDRDILRRIFENLIRNALVHGEGDFHFRMESSGRSAVVTMRNHAPNLREEHIPFLFDRFYTSDPSRHRQTTGLGLAIAKRLAELMNGQIRAHMEKEQFVIVIQFESQKSRLL